MGCWFSFRIFITASSRVAFLTPRLPAHRQPWLLPPPLPHLLPSLQPFTIPHCHHNKHKDFGLWRCNAKHRYFEFKKYAIWLILCAMCLSDMIWDVTLNLIKQILWLWCCVTCDLWYVSYGYDYDLLTINIKHQTQSLPVSTDSSMIWCLASIKSPRSHPTKQIQVSYPFTELSATITFCVKELTESWALQLHLLLFLLGFFCCSSGLRQFQCCLLLRFFCPQGHIQSDGRICHWCSHVVHVVKSESRSM